MKNNHLITLKNMQLSNKKFKFYLCVFIIIYLKKIFKLMQISFEILFKQ